MGKKGKASKGKSKGQPEKSKHNRRAGDASNSDEDEHPVQNVVASENRKKKNKPSRLHILRQAFWQLLVPLVIGFVVAYLVKTFYKNARQWIRGTDADVGVNPSLVDVEVLLPVDVKLRQANWD